MQEPETTPARVDFMRAINRSAEAYHQVRAELPSNPSYHANQENQYKAGLAFLGQLPILYDLPSFQLYIACIAQGVSVGAIDGADAGRLCHVAQTAISAWKLANLIVPAAQMKQKAAQMKQEAAQRKENDPTPLPPKGNHPAGEDARQAALALPDHKAQMELYKSLRQRGIPVPSETDLRKNPLVALYFCDLAVNHLDQLPPPDDASGPQPDPAANPDPRERSKQAA